MDNYRKMQCVRGLLVSLDEQLARHEQLSKGLDAESENKIVDHYYNAIKEQLKQSEDTEKKELIIALHKQGVISQEKKMELLNKVKEMLVEDTKNIKTIIVNGKKHNIVYNRLPYHEILIMAFGFKYPNVDYTMTFSYIFGDDRDGGTIIPDAIVPIIDGIIFNVVDTSKT